MKAATEINQGKVKAIELNDGRLPTGATTTLVTAILEAGRKSLDNGGVKVQLGYGVEGNVEKVFI